jgi:hypothetical protein
VRGLPQSEGSGLRASLMVSFGLNSTNKGAGADRYRRGAVGLGEAAVPADMLPSCWRFNWLAM